MVTVTVSDRNARAMFPDAQCAESWPDAINGDYDPSCCRFPKSCSVREPSILGLVVDSPLVCERCEGKGRRMYGFPEDHDTEWYDCPDCNGTGLPTVTVESTSGMVECLSPQGIPFVDQTFTIHGKLTIGPAVPIVEHDDLSVTAIRSASDRWFLFTDMPNGSTDIKDITDQFGDQIVTPGRWAHPILNTQPEGITS